ncbi:MAG: prolyl oligopeptidase family serine peptidase [Acidobacteriota bacterium]
MRRFWLVLLSAVAAFAEPLPYQKPFQAILDILNAPVLPSLAVNPTGTYATLSDQSRYPSIAEVSQPMLRLAGIRINPRTNGLHLAGFSQSIILVKLPEGTKTPVALPANARASGLRWSQDGKLFAFMNTTGSGIDLWIGDPATGKTRQIAGVKLNSVLGDPFTWQSDSKTLIAKTIPAARGPAPIEPAVPIGPEVQESNGAAMGVATYEDLLTSPHDEDLFEYFATSQLAVIDTTANRATPIGKPGLLDGVSKSPDGKHLMISREKRPFSYLHPYSLFPTEVEVWDQAGKVTYTVASIPLVERVPLGGVRTGPRTIRWMGNEPATIMWVEALDGGNPDEKVPFRDQLMSLSAPFTGQAKQRIRTEERYGGIQFGKDFALITDQARLTRVARTFQVDLNAANPEPKLIWSRNTQDAYKDPGRPVADRISPLMVQSGSEILLDGTGASPTGDHPFLDRFNLATLKSERVFQSSPDLYETVEAVLDSTGNQLIIRRESVSQPPNYFLRNGDKEIALTSFKDPAPQVRQIKKQLVTYKRADGVPLSMNLYLPPDYKPGTKLPAVVWAYPREYNDAETAGQIRGSQNRFTTITGYSELFFLLQGYAVLDDATMPVVGTIDVVNNTYVQQVVSSAKAAIDKAAEMGYIDPQRVGVGGHSYGAFMTANLLAHSDLFKAGIAESGAYNRTLTPFGFQSERRSLWAAEDTYLKMSPFMFADKIKEPILFIHGKADDNSGTFPIQSDRMYQAVRGNGGTARLVFLPDEAHGYRAKETIEHVNWEKLRWFDMYVKGAPPTASSAQ